MMPRKLTEEMLARQLRLDFAAVEHRPMLARKAANNPVFSEVLRRVRQVRGTLDLEYLTDHVQDLDRQRLLEPTSLPKELRGYKRRPRPKTAIIALAAKAAYERRIHTAEVVRNFLGQHAAKLRRLADRLRAT
jgi:hypothetical protein